MSVLWTKISYLLAWLVRQLNKTLKELPLVVGMRTNLNFQQLFDLIYKVWCNCNVLLHDMTHEMLTLIVPRNNWLQKDKKNLCNILILPFNILASPH